MAKPKSRPRNHSGKPLNVAPRPDGVFGAAIYCRVSTIDQQTLPMQLKTAREFCERKGWHVVAVVEEKASGAKQRPARDELVAAARRKQIDAIVVWKLDRFGRSTSDLISTLDELASCGCIFASVTEALDMSTPSGRALVGMLSVFAGFERDMIQERVRAGLAAAKDRGKQLGRPRLGVEADVLSLSAQGLSNREVARRLGIGESTVRRALKAAS